MDGYNHYIRIDVNNIVIVAFSDAFQAATPTDILIESNAGRHYNPVLIDGQGNFIFKWNGTKMVQRTQTELFPLDYYKQQKINEIQNAASIALGTFKSTALGATPLGATPVGSTPVASLALTYLSGTNDMLLLEAEDRFMQSSDYDNLPVLWYILEQGDVYHNKSQLHKLYLDGRSAVQATKYKAKDLVAKVMAIVIDSSTNYDQAIAKIKTIVW